MKFALQLGFVMASLTLAGVVPAAWATETENFGIRALLAPGKMMVDGKTSDWDLSGGVFACDNVEGYRDQIGTWVHLMYDSQNLYVLARWLDESPLNNPGSVKGDHPFAGDCLQFRTITAANTPQERGQHFACWKDRDGIDVIGVEQGRNFNEGKIDDAKTQGARQAFSVNANGRSYTQEIAIPWTLLTRAGQPLKATDFFTFTVEPNFFVNGSRKSIKDVFKHGSNVDRVFTFRAYPCWGIAMLEAKGQVTPQPVRLSDSREFPVTMQDGLPVVDWTGLTKIQELAGFKPIMFEMPVDGYISLHIRNAQGRVIRQLLNAEHRKKGEHTVKWDGLTTPLYKHAGEPVPPDDYTWQAIYHTGIGVRLRGWASNAGSAPWDNGPTTNWGGDHGVPVAAATDGTKVYLGWNGSEAGKGMVACDLDGHVQWKHTRGAFGGASFIAVDGGKVYGMDGPSVIFCLDPNSGGYAYWADTKQSDVKISDLWSEAQRPSLPDQVVGFDVKNGKAYLSCPAPGFTRTHVRDWLKMLARLQQADDAMSKELWSQLDEGSRSRIDKAVKSGDLKPIEGHKPQYEDARDVIAGLLGALPRPEVESNYGELVVKARGEFVAVVDVSNGKVLHRWPVPAPGRLKVTGDQQVLVLSAETKVLALNPENGQTQTALNDLTGAVSVTTDAAGNVYVGTAAPDQQVQVFDRQGKPVSTIGLPGVRPATGPWVPERMAKIGGMVVDWQGKLWVTESLAHPKRVAVWDTGTGKLLKEYFGPTHYGASGAAIHPRDPDVMVAEACEWRIDPENGGQRCVGVFDAHDHNFARFCTGSNGHNYLAVTDGPAGRAEIFQRLSPGRYVLRATITRDPKNKQLEFWSDVNGDQAVQETETVLVKKDLIVGGYYLWSLNMNTDLTLYAGGPESLQFPVTQFTACGAPVWDTTSPHPLPEIQGALSSLDNRLLVSMQVMGKDQFIRGYELPSGQLKWEYPSQWSGVHGSHHAPPPEVGLLRGVFGFIGSANLPAPIGDLFAVNSNVGEYHLLTGSGFYLSRLFQPDPLKFQFPAKAESGVSLDNAPPGMGGEDFGGSMVQGADGKVYVEAGKTAAWNTEVVGLDSVRSLPGGHVTIAPGEEKLAEQMRVDYMQTTTARQQMIAKRCTPTFTANLERDFVGSTVVPYQKQDGAAVRSVAAWDDKNLYLGWDVQDATPWVNGATAAEMLYLGGDTVDFQLGTDPQAPPERAEAVRGDLRLSIGNFQGKPRAILYRKVAKELHPRTFSSGVVAEYKMDSVQELADFPIEVRKLGNRYVVETAVPWPLLEMQPHGGLQLRGDFGATHGDPAGQRTRLRTHWTNQHTGIVDDAVFELMMEPNRWGQLILQE